MTRLLETREVEKIWGRTALPEPFAAERDEPIGEIWFEPPPELPELLVKYLFTGENLSVQVHPSDDDAPKGASGKEECWLILDAAPGAKLAIGLERETAPEDLAQAARDGSIERLLRWHEVAAGDFFYLPAGTIHAIGSGITLAEIQQNCDITYRLYDYGRPRELQLDDAIRVARSGPYDTDRYAKRLNGKAMRLVAGPHFRLEYFQGSPGANAWNPEQDGGGPGALLLPLDGSYRAGTSMVSAGECALVAAGDPVTAATTDARGLLAYPL
ncbi:class I mannose-6-phosphate isomerase [Erythrobacter sp. LQ02-29]|uniref:class I mannose-6-phosphate isomerase n=1 Tax=Erythrobacter sp. LQ02-29 TaxID=2920384 RepID=UPI001F4EC05D|nr:class I mannose-6-phosphate isomerase [Erythrobacter sp. LQ02-29]MCP9222195.1 class I mannose-6-phosphate isomerase [Erythrobacter sp. LQ02-29]